MGDELPMDAILAENHVVAQSDPPLNLALSAPTDDTLPLETAVDGKRSLTPEDELDIAVCIALVSMNVEFVCCMLSILELYLTLTFSLLKLGLGLEEKQKTKKNWDQSGDIIEILIRKHSNS